MRLKKIVLAGMAAVMLIGAAGCGSDDKKDETKNEQTVNVDLSDIRDAVKNAYGEDYIPNMEYDDVFITETLDIEKGDYEQIVAEGPLVSFNIDTFIAVKAKADKADTVEKKLKDYRDYLVNDAMMYPTNAVKIQASKVIRHGNYVFFVCLGTIDTETEEKGDDAILEAAKKNTKLAEDTIDKFFK